MRREIIKIWVIFVFIGLSTPVIGLDDEEKSAIAAIKAGNIELLKSYLEKHPDVNCEFSNGKTGLYYAILYDDIIVSEFLLKRGADPELTAGDHSTLHWAIKYDRGRIARLLIEYGAEVDKPDKNLNTPLIYAAELDRLEICKILIDRGADPLHSNLKGQRASDHVFLNNESLTYKYLLSMEEQYKNQDSIPSMQDGPYIFYEAEGQVVLTYFERNQEKNLTRLVEKTILTAKEDTIVKGIGLDKDSYHIQHFFTPDPDSINTPGNIFVVGDIHGKYNALVNLLTNDKIIDSDLKWIFGEGQLVLLGDVFDRGGSVTETLWFLYELQIQARHSGGNVHLLLGNHEIMALTGDHRYLNDKYNYFTQYTQVYYYQLFEKNTVLGRWLRSQNVIVRINDYLFLHAGISPEFTSYGFTFSNVNTLVQQYLQADYGTEQNAVVKVILGSAGPLWYRGYFNTEYNTTSSMKYNNNDNDNLPVVSQQFIDNYLNSRGLKRMVIGHNEQSKINTSFNGRVISADIAIDESGKSSQGLLISGDQLFRCYSDGRKEQLE